MDEEQTTVGKEVRRAFAMAAEDAGADLLLFEDPERYGRALGLRGADLAELVGVIRSSHRARELSTKHVVVIEAAILAEMGRSWPFEGEQECDLRPFIDVTDVISQFVLRTRAEGIALDASVWTAYRSWGEALLRYTSRRANAEDAPDPNVADGLVAAKKLLSACSGIGDG